MRHWIMMLAMAAAMPLQAAAAEMADSAAGKGVRLERVTVYGRNKFGTQSPQMSAVTTGCSVHRILYQSFTIVK